MSLPVPKDDLPTNIVPAGDPPGPSNSPTAPKAASVDSTLADVPGSAAFEAAKANQPNGQRTTAWDLIQGVPGAFLSAASSIPAQVAGRATALVDPAAGKRVAEAMTYQPSERGQETLRRFGGLLEKSKLEGMGPIALPAGQGATKVIAGKVPDAKAAGALKSGFSLTPTEAGAGWVAKTVEGLAEEPKLAKAVSRKNAPVVNEKILTDMGLPKDAEVSIDSLRQVRGEAGKAYDAVRKAGRVATDTEYSATLDKLGAQYKSAAADFPDLVNADVEKVIAGLRRDTFDANSGVDMIRQLRESADQAFRNGDKGMGKVLRGGSDALEAQLDRHMTKRVMTGADPASVDALKNFKAARTRIAKTYAAEKALDGQGNFNPQAYAAALKKRKPLDGGALEVAEAASASPRSFQKYPTGSVAAPTWSDAIMALISGGKSVGKEALMLGARPGARAALTSGPYQRFQGSQQSAAIPIPSPEALRALQVAPMLPQEQR